MTSVRGFTMPKWGIEMQEGTVQEWLVGEGDAVTKGQPIVSVESDKIVDEIKAEFESTLRLIVVSEGETQPVGALLAVFADADASADEVQAFADSFEAADTGTAAGGGTERSTAAAADAGEKPAFYGSASPRALANAEEKGVDLTAVDGSGRAGRITYQDVVQASRSSRSPDLKGTLPLPEADAYASPMAVRLAAEHDIALTDLTGSGPRGRISKADVAARIGDVQPRSDAGSEVRRMDSMRRTIARRLTEAKQTIPHFYLRVDLAVDALLEKRERENADRSRSVSINDYLIHAVSRALVEHPDVNIQVHGDEIHRYAQADIALAVATERGLYAPVLRNVETMSVEGISRAVGGLVKKAKTGALTSQDLSGGACTVSNLGMFGIDQFDAIINPPQGSILAVGTVRRAWAESERSGGRFESRIHVSMACDHRAIDGATGAKFLAEFRRLVETPN